MQSQSVKLLMRDYPVSSEKNQLQIVRGRTLELRECGSKSLRLRYHEP